MDAWCAQFPDATENPRWHDLLRSGVAIFDLDFDAILAAMYAVSISAEGDCYVCVLLDPGIEAAALGASESAAPGARESAGLGAGESAVSGTASAQVFHTFTLDSGASRSFFRDRTTLTPFCQPVAVSLADPSGGPVLARYSTVLPCPAAPSGSLFGLYLPSFSTNLVAASSQVFAAASQSGPESAPCSCRLLSHQTLLWHHRLGHPSLPRLRGMASRVLGRQRAAPHSSEFPPTEAPLQTLHMDVWGPARIRGQGHERYFLLVVDDYSCYTTVFPLRSKGEVTEVLIDWIRVARLQLRERFGSDFPGIRQTFTLLASPQQNGIAERRIGMVMDVARTSMIHAAAPHFLWPFAVQYATHQINLQPRVSLPETSATLRWTGQVGDVSAFRVWGSRAFVRDLSADKLSSRAVPCVFLGFPPDAPGWQFDHRTSCCILSSQDVTFDESVPYYRLFPYRTAPLPPPSLFLAPGPPLVDPLPPQGPAPSGVSQSGGAVPGSAESGGAGPGGAEPGGAGSGGAKPERAEPGGAASGGAEPGATESGGVEPTGTGPGGPSGALSRRELPSPQELRKWFARRWSRAAGAGGTASAGGSAATGGTGAGGATGAGTGGSTSTGGAGAAGPGGARTGGTGAAGPTGALGAGAGGAAGVGATGGTGAGAGVSASGPHWSRRSVLVSWRSTRSSSVLGSSCEAEIYATAMAAQELRWLTYLLTDLGERPRSPPALYQRGQLRLTFVATRANTADIFTKVLPPGDHQRFCTLLGLVSTLPYLLLRGDVVIHPELALHFLTGLVTLCSPPLCLWGCEAEIYAGAMAAQVLRWLTYLLTDLGEPPRSPPVLYVDNKAMLALCREHRLEHRTKHIALRYFLARELQQCGQLRLAYVASQANTADIFTKALQPCDHQRFCTMLACFALLDWSFDP
ncbi:unnamed protein product [Closterium sp. NIES-53]